VIQWSSVSTDAATFQIVLIDNNSNNSTTQVLAQSVNTADGKYSFSNFVATPDTHYQINFVGNTITNSGILAQSQQFEVTKSGGKQNPPEERDDARPLTCSPTVAPTTTSTAGTATAAGTASQAATSASKTNAAVAVGASLGVSGPLVAALFMLF
jgi:hypothetical protein